VKDKFQRLVGQQWEDTDTGEIFVVSHVRGKNLLYSHVPGQGVTSGGCYEIDAWRVA